MALQARTSRSGAIAAVSVMLATWAAACTPASVRPAAGHVHRRPFDAAEDVFEFALHGALPGLTLPAGEVGAVVGQHQPQGARVRGHRASSRQRREPGLVTGTPCWQSGQASSA